MDAEAGLGEIVDGGELGLEVFGLVEMEEFGEGEAQGGGEVGYRECGGEEGGEGVGMKG